MNPKVDSYLKRQETWRAELTKLREIMLTTGLNEELKWGVPCYALGDKNVALIHAFKEYCAILFTKGVLLEDPKNLLIQQTANVQAARHLRFTSVAEVTKLEKTIKAFMKKAIEIERAGLRVPMKKTADYDVPEELASALAKNAKLKKAFEALTPGRQRGYIYYVSQAKLAKTREDRVAKHTPRILKGLGVDD